MRFIVLILIGMWTSLVLAQKGIPTQYMNNPAADLFRSGKTLTPDDVHKLMQEMKGHMDISTLNPTQKSDLWQNIFLGELPEENIPVDELDEVEYHSNVESATGIHRFNVLNKDNGKLYTMMVSKTSHSMLLAKGLLRKIGYKVPDIKYLPKVILKFKNETEKKKFLHHWEYVAYAGSPKEWVLEELSGNRIMVQDMVIMASEHIIYNLATNITSDMVGNRRLLSSLVVPLTIVNLTESINLFRWDAGVESNSSIMLYNDSQEEYQCTWEDARWISRRIEKLSRSDWAEIVGGSHLPGPIQVIVLEKLISRRNSILKLFKVDYRHMDVDTKKSSGVDLVDGKVITQTFPGQVERFAYGDHESPLSSSEMRSWVKSKSISMAIDTILSQINQLPFLGTDIGKINGEHFQREVEKATAKSVAEQKPAELPLKSWVIPTVRGQLVLSRNLVTGTYLGTDNLVQLVDSVGVAIGGGAFVGVMGLPSPLAANAAVEGMIMRSYSHLRPVTSLKQSLKYPFKNIFVPLVKRDYGKKLQEAANAVINEDLPEKEREAKVVEALKPFKESMEVGESILITDSLSVNAGLQVSADYMKFVVKASLGLVPGYVVISRFHLHRKSADEFQIYKDVGQMGSLSLNFSLNSVVPVLKATYRKGKGTASVKFFSLNLNPKNPDVIKNAALLRDTIVSNSTTSIEEEEGKKPFILNHKFKETTPSIGLLFWQWQWNKSSSLISVTNPRGDERNFRRDYHGRTYGRNYHAYVNSLISHWVGLIWDKKAGLNESSGSNPGYSFKGMAQNRYMTLDQEVDEKGHAVEYFIRLSRVHNGWSIKREEAERILEEMKTRYRHEFYTAPVLSQTQRIFLYNISLNMFFYQAGIEHVFNLSADEIRKIFRSHLSQVNLVISPEKIQDKDTGVDKFLRFLEKHKYYRAKGDDDNSNKYLIKAFSQAEYKLTLAGITALVGGTENLFVNSRIDGFREGDEDAKKAVISSSMGELGSQNVLGPLVQVQRQTEMLEGEFFIYWLMTRLI